MKRLDASLAQAKAEGVFSQASVAIWWKGQPVYEGGSAAPDAIFDLASVTKVMCTTSLVCRLAARGELDVNAPLSTVLPGASVAATIADLAFHRSGLPAFLPFFAEVARDQPALFADPPAALREQVRKTVVDRVLRVKAERSVGAEAVYSDLGFILLGEALSAVARRPLDALFVDEVATPLGLSAGFRRLSLSASPDRVVDTGGTRPREPAPGQETMWRCPTWPSRVGQVDDDNAWVMDGVAGHAGLFATATDVARFGQAVLDGWVTSPVGWKPDVATPGSTRTFGFDTPSTVGASCGPRFGRGGPLGAIGHLGFTGTSLWLDLDRQLVVALLTNRVVFGRSNVLIRAFRPAFHDSVLDVFSS
ncbi:MAG: serine hydrolase domain-containing protein [Myxococcales bacterium]|nr:serine hydrolase domain-containing protein [Myxococcales bacterium]